MSFRPSTFATFAVALVTITALAGCGGKDGGGTTPSGSSSTSSRTSGTSSTTGGTNTTGGMPMAMEVYNKTHSFSLQAAPAGSPAKFSVSMGGMTQMTFTAQLRYTSACYVLANEPPSGPGTGPAPGISFKPPSGTAVALSIPTVNNCSMDASTTGKIGAPITKNGPAEMGEWTMTITGRGANVDVVVTVVGQ